MDLQKLNIPDTIKVHLSFPGSGKLFDNDLPVEIELYSPAANSVIAYQNSLQELTLKKAMTNEPVTAKELNQDKIDRLVAFTADVHNLEYNGEKVTKDNVFKIYSDPKLSWINDQLQAKLNSWNSFLAK